MQLKVVQNRAETQAALENVRETLKKRIDEIFNELERRSQKEETAYAGASKATRDMMLISSYVSFGAYFFSWCNLKGSVFRSVA